MNYLIIPDLDGNKPIFWLGIESIVLKDITFDTECYISNSKKCYREQEAIRLLIKNIRNSDKYRKNWMDLVLFNFGEENISYLKIYLNRYEYFERPTRLIRFSREDEEFYTKIIELDK